MFTEAVGHQPVLPSPTAARLFTPWRCRGVQARNRVVISPMQQYSAQDGLANDWHLMHLGGFSLGAAGLQPGGRPSKPMPSSMSSGKRSRGSRKSSLSS